MDRREIDPDAPVGRRHEQAERRDADLVDRLRGYESLFRAMCPGTDRDPKPEPVQ